MAYQVFYSEPVLRDFVDALSGTPALEDIMFISAQFLLANLVPFPPNDGRSRLPLLRKFAFHNVIDGADALGYLLASICPSTQLAVTVTEEEPSRRVAGLFRPLMQACPSLLEIRWAKFKVVETTRLVSLAGPSSAWHVECEAIACVTSKLLLYSTNESESGNEQLLASVARCKRCFEGLWNKLFHHE